MFISHKQNFEKLRLPLCHAIVEACPGWSGVYIAKFFNQLQQVHRILKQDLNVIIPNADVPTIEPEVSLIYLSLGSSLKPIVEVLGLPVPYGFPAKPARVFLVIDGPNLCIFLMTATGVESRIPIYQNPTGLYIWLVDVLKAKPNKFWYSLFKLEHFLQRKFPKIAWSFV